MHQVSVKVIVSEKGFRPGPELMASRHLHRAWREGDLVIPQATKKFDDAGVTYRLMHEHADADRTEVVLVPLKKVAAQIKSVAATTALPIPHLSVFIETDGSDYPPIFLSRELLAVVDSMHAEIDVDVVNSL